MRFSPERNLKKIFFSPPPKEKELMVLNGVRVLSMWWVMLGHAYSYTLQYPTSNLLQLEVISQDWYSPLIYGGFFSVDVFFFMSAFLGAYLLTGRMAKNPTLNPIWLLKIYVHRYIRLIPAVILSIIFMLTFYRFIGDGPMWWKVQ